MMNDKLDTGTLTIIGTNQYSEMVVETVSSDVLNDPIVQTICFAVRAKYAASGIDIDAELQKWQEE